jgi:hypothetical protein
MLGHVNRQLAPRGLALATAPLACAIVLAAGAARSQPRERASSPCRHRACIVIEHDAALSAEAGALVEALGLRLAKHDVHVELGASPATDQPATEPEPAVGAPGRTAPLWVVHLRKLSAELVLLAVDNLSIEGENDLVRELRRGPTPEATAWTLALMVDEVVGPYVEQGAEQAPLGAGLSIIEPAVVGGTRKDDDQGEQEGARLRLVSVALAVYRMGQADDFIAGPRAAIEGGLSRHVVASIGLGWVGWAEFAAHGTGGSTSLLPLDVLFGYVFMPERVVELTAAVGFSVGFSVYRASRDNHNITEVLFEPLGQLSLRAAFRVFGPLALYVDGGAAFVFVRDELRDAGQTIYRQDWVMPFFDIGFQFWFI